MSPSSLLLLGVIGSGVLFTVLTPVVFHETQRTRDLDRRLTVSRSQTAKSYPKTKRSGLRDKTGLTLRIVGLGFMRFLSMLVPIGGTERDKLVRMLQSAGFGRPEALSYFLSAKLGSALLFGAVAGIGTNQSDFGSEYRILVLVGAGIGLVIGGILPEFVLRAISDRRQRKMAAALPHALDLLVMCVETGLTFERALTVVADELKPIERHLANEFRVIDAEMRVGTDRRTVLQEYYRRSSLDGLRDLAMAVIQGDRYGTPVAQATKNIASSERVQRSARITAQAERLPVLMSLPMMMFVVPGTMVLVAGPAFLNALKAMSSLGG